METTRSFSSSTLGSILASATRTLLKDQSAGASCVGERLHSSVVHVPASIEHDALDALRLRLARQELADELGGGDVAAARLARAEFLAPAVHRQQGAPEVVVDQLGVDVVQAAEHGQPRPRARAAQEPAQAPVPDISRRAPLFRDHLLGPRSRLLPDLAADHLVGILDALA